LPQEQGDIVRFVRWLNHPDVGAKIDMQAHDNYVRGLYDGVTPSGGASLLKESNPILAREAEISITTDFRLTPYHAGKQGGGLL